jgi:hypothetical protein
MSSSPQILGYCRACGKALDEANLVNAHGTIYCKEHAPAVSESTAAPPPFGASPYTAPYTASGYTQGSPYSTPPPMNSGLNSGLGAVPHPEVSPGLAFLLGMIPGVGAIYNGQYAKGLIHVVILGLMISIISSGSSSGLEPLMGMMIAAFWAYMCFEAYHTAKQRRMGLNVDEFSSIFPMKGGKRFPAAPIILIVFGVVFLLNNLEWFELRRALKYWPVFLIGLGVYMLYARYSASGVASSSSGAEPKN